MRRASAELAQQRRASFGNRGKNSAERLYNNVMTRVVETVDLRQ